jgi:hypothetical protein
MSKEHQFKPGHQSKGGRRKNSRDRIATSLLEAFAQDFEEHGVEAVKICRLERPTEYLRIAASLLPKEFEQTVAYSGEVVHSVEHIKRTIVDPKTITIQAEPVRLLSKAPTLDPEPKPDLGGLYE